MSRSVFQYFSLTTSLNPPPHTHPRASNLLEHTHPSILSIYCLSKSPLIWWVYFIILCHDATHLRSITFSSFSLPLLHGEYHTVFRLSLLWVTCQAYDCLVITAIKYWFTEICPIKAMSRHVNTTCSIDRLRSFWCIIIECPLWSSGEKLFGTLWKHKHKLRQID